MTNIYFSSSTKGFHKLPLVREAPEKVTLLIQFMNEIYNVRNHWQANIC